MNLDIQYASKMAVFLAGGAAIILLISGIQIIRRATKLRFFRIRQDRIVRGWKLIGLATLLIIVALAINTFAEPIAYKYFPPTPTITQTPTITLSPTVTLSPTISPTPTITETPSESYTPTPTVTPHVPLAVEAQFEGELTPPANAIFSVLQFTSLGVDDNYSPIEPSEVFTNPVGSMYAVFSYDGMETSVQWTALWYRNGDLVHYETLVWDGGTGGMGYADWHPTADEWLPGEYQVQLFLGLDVARVGFFTVLGEPVIPSVTATLSASETSSPTITIIPPTGTKTPWPTATRVIPTPTITRWPTATWEK